VSPGDLCHIVFTSGTTGTPKGVAVEHRSLLAYAKAKAADQSVAPESRLLLASAFTFDPYIGDVATALVTGASLAMASRGDILTKLRHCLLSLRATHVCCTPAHWTSLGEESGPDDVPEVRCVALGGEKMTRALIKQWATRTGSGGAPWKFMNTYGVTEATVYQTTAVCRSAYASPSVLGQPMPGVKIMLMKLVDNDDDDDDGEDDAVQSRSGPYECIPAATSSKGVVGEICLGGEQIARGYLNRPGLTASRFITVAHSSVHDGEAKGDDQKTRLLRLYRTGDLGRWVFPSSSPATLEILGRSDRQVKIRGRRVELGEIESTLLAGSDASGIAKAAFVEYLPLVLHESAGGTALKNKSSSVLVAGIRLEDDRGDGSGKRNDLPLSFHPLEHACPWKETILREQCQRLLAPHMVPSYYFCAKGALPLTRSGKMDRRGIARVLNTALHEMMVHDSSAEVPVLVDPIERALASVWRGHLGVSRPLLSTDDFFRLGGDSLGALRASREFAKTWVVGGMELIDNVTDEFGNVHHALSALVMLRNPVLRDYAKILRQAGLCVVDSQGAQAVRSGAVINEAVDSGGFVATSTITGGTSTGTGTGTSTGTGTGTGAGSDSTTVSLSPLDKALRDASEHGDVGSVRALLALGVDPDSGVKRKSPGVSALHAAVAGGHTEVTEMLLAAGARITVCTVDRTTPVHIAAQRSVVLLSASLGVAEEDIGALEHASVQQQQSLHYVRIQDGAKQSLLHRAARSGNIETVRLLTRLLKKQRDMMEAERVANARKKKSSKLTAAGVLDPRDRWHRTPLHWAIVNGHVKVVAHLLEHGALAQPYDPNHMKRMENHVGSSTHLPMETPLQLAVRVHGADSEFASLLRLFL
jgi:acyl-CoA synthetase (AMP-forming)/AMP-acid ligase II/ankyrin repeat protein